MSQPVTNNKKQRASKSTPGIGRMLLLSFILHVVVFFVFGGFIVPRIKENKKPIYYVDLIHPPVANPQAGRPDVAPVKKKEKPKKKPKKKTKPVVEKPAVKKAVPIKKSVPVVKKEVVPVPVAVKSKTTAPVAQVKPTIVPVEQPATSNPMDAIEQMRRKQRIAALKEKLARLSTEPSTAPVGVVGGSGDQAGVDYDSWIKSFLSQAWALPSHYRQRGFIATMALRFNSQGQLIYAEMVRSSGDNFFDASVKRAVQQLQRLPNEPKKQIDLNVTFDPREIFAQ